MTDGAQDIPVHATVMPVTFLYNPETHRVTVDVDELIAYATAMQDGLAIGQAEPLDRLCVFLQQSRTQTVADYSKTRPSADRIPDPVILDDPTERGC